MFILISDNLSKNDIYLYFSWLENQILKKTIFWNFPLKEKQVEKQKIHKRRLQKLIMEVLNILSSDGHGIPQKWGTHNGDIGLYVAAIHLNWGQEHWISLTPLY